MRSRIRYKTKQREILLGYFETVPGIHVTAADVCRYFQSHHAAIGQSTIYRNLESLVDEGVIKKYAIDGNSAACFEYVEPDGQQNTETCFHCKCEKCGKLIHLQCDELNGIQHHLITEHQFKMNPVRTVFYGLCEHCM
ncbi:MAG: transcriptional repressor [Clostridiales bacterium]|nr:transcriptional repressor [Clostridiales bacterium]